MFNKISKKWLIGFLVIWTIGVVGMVLFPNEDKVNINVEVAKDSYEDVIKKVNKDALVEFNNKAINIESKFGNVDADIEVKSALADIIKILDKTIEYKEYEYNEIVIFDFKSEFKDKYNKVVNDSALKIAFNISELKKVDTFKDMSYEQLLLLKSGNVYIAPAVNEKLDSKTIDILRSK